MLRLLLGFYLLGLAILTANAELPQAPAPRTAESEVAKRLPRGLQFAERGQIDLFVACTVAWKLKVDDLRQWEPAAEFGRKLIDKAEMKGDRKPLGTPSSYKDFATYLETWKPRFTRVDGIYSRPDPDKAVPPVAAYYEAIQAPGIVDPDGPVHCLVISRGSVQAGTGIQGSVVFANGDVTAQTVMSNVVIVCDGDVTVAEKHILKSVIVARGNITAKSAGTVVLMAGGKIELENKAALKAKGTNVILENERNTLGVTFFELSQIGMEVKVAEGAVQVAKVAAKSECEKAGVKPGDVILEVSGKKPADAESLRRLLRDALAVGDAAVKVKRGNDTLTLKLSLPE